MNEITVTLTQEQYDAVQAVVVAENVTASDVLGRYASRLAQIQAQNKKAELVTKYEQASASEKAEIDAAVAKVNPPKLEPPENHEEDPE